MFRLHPQLDQDTVTLGRFPLSLVLLVKDANYPWCILVPQRENITEIHQLEKQDQQQLLEESCGLAQAMEALFTPDKMNIAAIGNKVPQLHLHHVARFEADAVWPQPIWGAIPAIAYSDDELSTRVGQLQQVLQPLGLDIYE